MKLISAKELAARYGVSTKTVRKWARVAFLPVVRFNCRCIRFDVEKCDAVVHRRTRISGFVNSRFLAVTNAIVVTLLLTFLVANPSTIGQLDFLKREVIAFVNRWSSVQTRQPAP